ncbi:MULTISPECIES: type 1 glutamine amidotransferase domain-containing protein [Asaia]|uniref:type 1 glutamine amidotransferase domain-containing protein n=1 Tax=Asaia TaxID=91914 RepID=UPI002FC3A62D
MPHPLFNILMVVTSHAALGTSGHPTGVWFEELTTPYYIFRDAGATVDIASIAGGKIPVDPRSIHNDDKDPESVKRFLKDQRAVSDLDHSRRITGISVDGYDAVFIPGGHGVMWDMPNNTPLQSLILRAWSDGKVVASVCHGPASLTGLRNPDGTAFVKGRKISAFTDSEEEAAGLTATVPFLLESRLREEGAVFEKGADFKPYMVRDGRLITGQNPQSSALVAQEVLSVLAEGRGAR